MVSDSESDHSSAFTPMPIKGQKDKYKINEKVSSKKEKNEIVEEAQDHI
jgi:hypothetical protein